MDRLTALYLRISQDRAGSELGVDRQRQSCTTAAQLRDAPLDREYVDNDISATTGKVRPDFEKLLADVEAREVGTIVALNLDRLLRTNRDRYRLLEACQAHEVNIVLAKGTDIDMRTAVGRMVADQLATAARFEVEVKAERQRAEREQAAERGWAPPSRRAFGYHPRERAVGHEAPVTHLNTDEAPLVAEAYRQVVAGRSMGSIARWLNVQGSRSTNGNPWTYHSLWYVLTNPRYKGVRGVRRLLPGREGMAGKREKFHTEIAKGQWEPIVSAEVWSVAQSILRDPARRVNHVVNTATYLLAGIASCGLCGETMVSGTRVTKLRTNGDRVHDRLLRCSALRHVNRKAEPVEEYVEEIVLLRLEDPEARRVLARRVARPEELDELRARQTQLTRDIDDARAMVGNGITLADFAAFRKRWEPELAEVERRLAATYQQDPIVEISGTDAPRSVWAAWPIETRRVLLRACFDVKVHSGKPGRPGGLRFDPASVTVEWKLG